MSESGEVPVEAVDAAYERVKPWLDGGHFGPGGSREILAAALEAALPYLVREEEREPPPARRCADPDCDGEAGHGGPHYQWVPE